MRVALLAPPLRNHGIDLQLFPLLAAHQYAAFATAPLITRARTAVGAHRRLAKILRELPPDVDAVLVQRHVGLLPTLGLERAATGRRRLVLDIDDAIWHDGALAGGHSLAQLKGASRKVRWLADRAEHVIAGNALLAEHLAPYSKRISVIPSLVDVASVALRRHDERDELVLGWIGSATTAPYLEQLAPLVARFARSVRPRPVELLVVGGHIRSVAGARTNCMPWTEEAERAALGRIDIGLMPLPDNAWTRGKCAYKALQYMAAGIPVVADDVGISADVVGDGAAGRIARKPHEWVDALVDLAASPEARTRLGLEGRRRVETGFSHERWVPEIARILRGG